MVCLKWNETVYEEMAAGFASYKLFYIIAQALIAPQNLYY
jgi:hypothetical protein